MRRWRGLKALIHDAVDRTTELVDEGHESTSRSVMRVLGATPVAEPARVVDAARRVGTRGVLGTIRVINRAVEAVTDAGLDLAERSMETGPDAPVAMRSDGVGSAGWIADAALGLVNGAVGDHLSARENGLDLGMSIRHGERYLALEPSGLASALAEAPSRVALFVHGLGTAEGSWCLGAEAYHGDPAASFGSLLERDLGYAPLYVRYNTGRHVSENGRLLARELERLTRAWPAELEELVLVGHSMGGLVARSALHYASEQGLAWPAKVRRVFCLASPHHGAPLARLGHLAAAVLDMIDTPGTRIPARILQGRSAGIKDLRHGSLVDEDWLGQDPDALRAPEARAVPLLDHVRYHFLSATVTADPEHPLGQLAGDLLVRVPSATGVRCEHRTFPIETACFGGVLHHQLQNHPAVYAVLRRCCEEPASDAD